VQAVAKRQIKSRVRQSRDVSALLRDLSKHASRGSDREETTKFAKQKLA